MSSFFLDRFELLRRQVDSWIEDFYDSKRRDFVIDRACSSSVTAPGKRIRPVLALDVCSMLSLPHSEVRSFALALELIHTATLIHDDLPSLDNDSLRRGRPTCHIVYGEGQALLAGDELFSQGIALVAEDSSLCDRVKVLVISLLCEVMSNVNYGQSLDLILGCSEGVNGCRSDSFEGVLGGNKFSMLLECYAHKTSKLLAASIAGPALLKSEKGRNSLIFKELFSFGEFVGLAFQITDDLMSFYSTSCDAGKNMGKERDEGKLTIPALVGVERSLVLVDDYCDKARTCLDRLQNDLDIEFLLAFCCWIGERSSALSKYREISDAKS